MLEFFNAQLFHANDSGPIRRTETHTKFKVPSYSDKCKWVSRTCERALKGVHGSAPENRNAQRRSARLVRNQKTGVNQGAQIVDKLIVAHRGAWRWLCEVALRHEAPPEGKEGTGCWAAH